MLKNVDDPNDLRQLLLSLLSTSGTLAGLSLALVGLVNVKIASTKVETLADDIFLFASLGFLITCYLIFFALRHHRSKSVRCWTNFIDIVFLFSLTLLVVGGFAIVYALV